MVARLKTIKHDAKAAYHNRQLKRIAREKEVLMEERTQADDVIDEVIVFSRRWLKETKAKAKGFLDGLAPEEDNVVPLPTQSARQEPRSIKGGRFVVRAVVSKGVIAENMEQAELKLKTELRSAGYQVDQTMQGR
jgi:hypothetical protein